MKKLLFCLALLTVSLPVLRADDTSTPAASSQQDKTDKFKAVMGQLDLTDDQKAKVKKIMATTEPGPGRRRQIMAVLTPEQRQKLRELMQAHQQQ